MKRTSGSNTSSEQKGSMLYRLLLGLVALSLLAFIITQIIVPTIYGGPLFPILRKSVRDAELERDEALVGHMAANIEQETEQANRKASSLRGDRDSTQ